MAVATVPFVLPTVVIGAAFLALLPDVVARHGHRDDRSRTSSSTLPSSCGSLAR